MEDANTPGILLLVEFDWPKPFEPDHGRAARALHDAVVGQGWIREIVAGSGGLGDGPGSVWVFRLENYAGLDRLLREQQDPVHQAYVKCFTIMENVVERVREEVIFL